MIQKTVSYIQLLEYAQLLIIQTYTQYLHAQQNQIHK